MKKIKTPKFSFLVHSRRAIIVYQQLWCHAKFWHAPIGRNRSRDAIVSLLRERVPVLAIFAQNLVLYNKNNRVPLSQALMCDKFPRKFDVQTSYKPSNYVLRLIFVVNIKFSRATYHTIVPSTEELYCLRTFALIVGLHPYCARNSRGNVMPHASSARAE